MSASAQFLTAEQQEALKNLAKLAGVLHLTQDQQNAIDLLSQTTAQPLDNAERHHEDTSSQPQQEPEVAHAATAPSAMPVMLFPDVTPEQEKILQNLAMAKTFQQWAMGMDLKSPRLGSVNMFLIRALEKRMHAYVAMKGASYPTDLSLLSTIKAVFQEDTSFFRTKNARTDFWHLHQEAHKLRSLYREVDLPLGYTGLLLNLNRYIDDGMDRMIEASPMAESYQVTPGTEANQQDVGIERERQKAA